MFHVEHKASSELRPKRLLTPGPEAKRDSAAHRGAPVKSSSTAGRAIAQGDLALAVFKNITFGRNR